MSRPLRTQPSPASLRLDMPSLRRMPPPSRLPEFDFDGAVPGSAAPQGRSHGMLAALLRLVRR
jgi:hypothetical protein